MARCLRWRAYTAGSSLKKRIKKIRVVFDEIRNKIVGVGAFLFFEELQAAVQPQLHDSVVGLLAAGVKFELLLPGTHGHGYTAKEDNDEKFTR